MKKNFLAILVSSLALSACLPAFLQPPQGSATTPDSQATIAAGLTRSFQTDQPQASPSLAPSATRTVTKTTTSTPDPATETLTVTVTETIFATPATGTVMTPTNVTGTPGTPVLPSATDGSPTPTLHPRFYGTQPPIIDFGRLRVINKSKAEVYISVQCVTSNGQVSIIEYPVPRRINVNAPAGKCTYVVWVGGRQMSGQFALGKGAEKTITIYKDHIAIK